MVIAGDTPIVVLTGAGISRESGLHTFRDADGIWATVRIEDVATPEAFARDRVPVHAFYNARRRALLDAAVVGCGLFVSIGTSGNVRPAAGVVAALLAGP